MKSVKNSFIRDKEGGGHGPPTKFNDGRKKRSVNLQRVKKKERKGGRETDRERLAMLDIVWLKGSRSSLVILNAINLLRQILSS